MHRIPKEVWLYVKCSKKDIRLAATSLYNGLYPKAPTMAEGEQESHILGWFWEGIQDAWCDQTASWNLFATRFCLSHLSPNSAICEQTFSIAESFKTKKRNWLEMSRRSRLAQKIFLKVIFCVKFGLICSHYPTDINKTWIHLIIEQKFDVHLVPFGFEKSGYLSGLSEIRVLGWWKS